MLKQPFPCRIQGRAQLLIAGLGDTMTHQNHTIHAAIPHRVQAKGFARQTFDAIAFVRAFDVFFGDRQSHACRAGCGFARQNNDPVARKSHGVIEDIFEFGRAQQACALWKVQGAQSTLKLNVTASCALWRGVR